MLKVEGLEVTIMTIQDRKDKNLPTQQLGLKDEVKDDYAQFIAAGTRDSGANEGHSEDLFTEMGIEEAEVNSVVLKTFNKDVVSQLMTDLLCALDAANLDAVETTWVNLQDYFSESDLANILHEIESFNFDIVKEKVKLLAEKTGITLVC